MAKVIAVWALQIAILLALVMSDADVSGFNARLRRVFTSKRVWCLAAGCLAFLWASATSARAYDIAGASFGTVSFYIEAILLLGAIISILFRRLLGGGGIDLTFGSAKFATAAHARALGLLGETGIRLGFLHDVEADGRYQAEAAAPPLHYTGERHLLTVAPTRSGKGVSVIIPNLLTRTASAIVIDPKGENAAITYARRRSFGQVFALDPWAITGQPAARYNPLDLLTPDSPTLIDDAALIAETLIVEDSSDGVAKHFADQANDFVKGVLLHLAVEPEETRTLGRLRQILTMPPKELAAVGMAMARSPHPIVRQSAAMLMLKTDNERSGVLSTAQRNTHFLDSPALQASLAASDFSFAQLKRESATVYIALPVQRLATHARWLRLLIATAIAELGRTPAAAGQPPVLLLLDEFAALGRLQIVEDAYGLMAGMGLQLHAIVQDISQLTRLYQAGWQTFVANAGVLQFFNTRDLATAEYVSKLIGVTTRTVRSTSENWSSGSSSGSSYGPGGVTSNSGSNSSRGGGVSHAPAQRPLLFPDELMRMPEGAQIVFIENADPVLARKIVYHADPTYQRLAAPRPVPALGAAPVVDTAPAAPAAAPSLPIDPA